MASAAPPPPPTHFREVLAGWRGWWTRSVVGTVNQAEVIEKRREESEISERYLFMLAMSAGIAILGLLLSSPAVVIGAMLLSPLMDPIIGLGFALATGDYDWMKKAARSLLVGTALAMMLCALVVVLSPLQTVTSEIAARTRPNLFDLLVALFSALAGAYAMIRGREGTIVGVAIATALMPPLAVVGFGLATLNWTVFSGALLLYFTNLMTIALTAAVMARLYGFRTSLSPKHTVLQNILIALALAGLAIPLTLALWRVAREANDTRLINSTVRDIFDDRARLSQIDVDFRARPIEITATVLAKTDPATGAALVDLVADQAEQKGTGRWTVQNALDLGVPITGIAEVTASRPDRRAGEICFSTSSRVIKPASTTRSAMLRLVSSAVFARAADAA